MRLAVFFNYAADPDPPEAPGSSGARLFTVGFSPDMQNPKNVTDYIRTFKQTYPNSTLVFVGWV